MKIWKILNWIKRPKFFDFTKKNIITKEKICKKFLHTLAEVFRNFLRIIAKYILKEYHAESIHIYKNKILIIDPGLSEYIIITIDNEKLAKDLRFRLSGPAGDYIIDKGGGPGK